jgi:hypothetical protein
VSYSISIPPALSVFADGCFKASQEGTRDKASPLSDHSEKEMYHTNVYAHVAFKHIAIRTLIS